MKLAFSLVELSIVLVILGLLTGGILTGQNLIRAAEIRSVTTEFQRHQAAVNSFRDKYFAIPGDITNATDFWGAAQAGGGCDTTTAGSGTQTCNGDGAGDVQTMTAAEYGERFTFWQHLANAGLIEGSYTGMAGAGHALETVLGQNAPASKLGTAGWSVSTWVTVGTTNAFAYDYQNHFIFGAVSTQQTTQGALSPEEAWNIDTKLDDSKAGTGRIIARQWDTCTDAATHGGTTEADRINASYDFSVTSAECALMFPNAF